MAETKNAGYSSPSIMESQREPLDQSGCNRLITQQTFGEKTRIGNMIHPVLNYWTKCSVL